MSDFKQYLKDFPKHPILIEQEAAIVAAMIDGTISKNTAKELFLKVCEHNLKKYDEFTKMNSKELLLKING